MGRKQKSSKQDRKRTAAERQRQANMTTLLAQVSHDEELNLDEEDEPAAKQPFLSKDKEGTSFAFFDGDSGKPSPTATKL